MEPTIHLTENDLENVQFSGALPETVKRLAGEMALEWLTACFAVEIAGSLITELQGMAKAHQVEVERLGREIKTLEAKASPLREKADEARRKSRALANQYSTSDTINQQPPDINRLLGEAEKIEAQVTELERARYALAAVKNKHEAAAFVAGKTITALQALPQPGKPPALLVELVSKAR